MHNRNFIINMVINGEKTPAFSASTLTLPVTQVDNSSRIIEHTRRYYSRNRADIEREISESIQPPANLAPKQPQSQTLAKKWPVDAGARPAVIAQPRPATTPATSATSQQPATAPQTAQTTPQQGSAPTNAPAVEPRYDEDGNIIIKKKRTRTRKRKPASARPADDGSLPPVVATPQRQPDSAQRPQSDQQQTRPVQSPSQQATPQPATSPATDSTELRLR